MGSKCLFWIQLEPSISYIGKTSLKSGTHKLVFLWAYYFFFFLTFFRRQHFFLMATLFLDGNTFFLVAYLCFFNFLSKFHYDIIHGAIILEDNDIIRLYRRSPYSVTIASLQQQGHSIVYDL